MEKFDYIIVGSGFGGSVAAMRLGQKGYRVALFEEGKRFKDGDYSKNRKSMKKILWKPKLGYRGIYRFWPLKNVVILGGAGVGGGSNNYANTLYVPSERFFKHPAIQGIGGGRGLMPYYQIAKKMLGVVENNFETSIDKCFKEVIQENYPDGDYQKTPVGIYFGEKGKEDKDPYFLGEGMPRKGCELCGGCMTGCNFNSKNTLEKNYLFFAEKFGVKIFPLHKVVDVNQVGQDGVVEYQVDVEISDKGSNEKRKTFFSGGIIFSAGVMGTLSLLLKLKMQNKFSELSDELGNLVRTNSEAFIAIRSQRKDVDLSEGVTITSSAFANDNIHVQPIRFASGIFLPKFRISVYTDEKGFFPRQLKFLFNIITSPIKVLRWYNPKNYDKQTILLMVMQNINNDIKLKLKKNKFSGSYRITSSKGLVNVPKTIKAGEEFAKHVSKKLNGIIGNLIYDILLNTPFTAHILGGCRIGKDKKSGVIDFQNKVFGYENMYVCDASMIPANLGVNPALTIVAITEKAMSGIIPKTDSIHYLKIEKEAGVQELLNSTANNKINKPLLTIE